MIEFERFSLDTERKILFRDGEIVNLAPKAAEVLCVLVVRMGEFVSKQELLDAVWGDVFVEESNLTHQIYELRKFFREHESISIQTVSRRGYKFAVANTESATVSEPTDIPAETPIAAPPAELPVGKARSWRFLYVAAAIFAIAAVTAAAYFFIRPVPRKLTIRSIAVLPPKSLSSGGVDDALRMKLTDSLITKLGRLPGLSVRPTASMASFLNSRQGAVEIGRQLDVDVIADGTLEIDNGRLRVKISLFSVSEGKEIWSEQFSGEPEKLLPLQDSISARIASHLDFRLSNEQSAAFSGNITSNADAYEAYLRGRYLWTRRSAANLVQAITEFERAVILDPGFALAYAGLGDCYALLSVYDERPPKQAFPKAAEYARKALEIDPNLAEALTTLAFIEYRFEWKWAEAEQHFARAIELKPNYPTAHHWLGELLNARGRFADGEISLRRALTFDPTSSVIKTDLGYGLMLAGKFDLADSQLQQTVTANSEFPLAYYCLWDNQLLQGRADEAARSFLMWMEKAGFKDGEIDALKSVATSGDGNRFLEAQLKWAETENARNYFTKFDFARFALARGDQNEALRWLNLAFEERSPDLIFIKVHPAFAPLRTDPRFVSILTQMNL